MDTISVYQANNEFLAMTIRDMLLENEVRCMIRQNHSSAFGGALSQKNWGDVLVFSSDEDRARELIGGFQGTLGMLSEHVEDPEGLDYDE
jgi:hypothetical protein